MIPLRDLNPRRTFPAVNVLLIVLNILMFCWEVSLGSNLESVLAGVAFVPSRLWLAGRIIPSLASIMISMFLHGGLLHIAGNMLYLWIFGDNIEDRLGHGRYLFFYLACGFAATLAHAFMNPSSIIPTVGASGAIAGVLGAYLILFPRARVTTLIPIFIFITIRQIPAIFVLGLWFVLQVFSTVGSIQAGTETGGVAYAAHVGGFAFGMVLIVLLGGVRRRRA